jgi:subtilase family serine protease/DNA repair exonuclease SbcCD nuclease subunit
MRKGDKAIEIWDAIVILAVIVSILWIVGITHAGADDIIIDTEKGESRFTTDPNRVLPYEWWYVRDHDVFHTDAYAGNFWYTFCIPGMAEYKGIWQASLPHSGSYEVFVWLPDPDPFDPNMDEYEPPNVYLPTKMARYKVFHKAGVDTVTIDQSVNKGGFTSLGVFDFDTTAKVELVNNNVEYWRCIAFDAVKFVPQNQPDLIVDDIWIEPTEFGPGDTVDLRVRIKNIGDADAEGFALKRYIDDSYNAPPYGVEGLAAGWSATLPSSWTLIWPSDCNSHKVKVWIDADGVVPESNENNNVLSLSFSAKCVHDMAVTNVYTTPASPNVGESSTIYVTVKNEGTQQESSVPVKAFVDGSQVGSTQYVTLSASQSTTKSFSWTPSTAKTYSVKGEVGVVSGETDTADNSKTISVGVSVHDMAVTNLYTTPASPNVGESTTIHVTVKNEGSQQENSVPVKAYVDGVQKGSTQYVTLSTYQSTTKSFSWTPDTAKTYSVKGEVGIVSGETDTTDNSKTISVSTQSPAKPVLVSPLEITPEKETYYIGDTLTAEFTIKNIGDVPITLDKLLVGGRFNNGKLPNGEFPDFTFQSTTLQPNVSHQYTGTLELTHPGIYQFFIAYYIENPTPEEKKLLDENNWNTCVDLGEGLTDEDRTEDIAVLEKTKLTAILGGPYQSDVNQRILFHGSATGGTPPYSFEWTFYDTDKVEKVTDQYANYTWSTAGTYHAELRVKDSTGSGSWSEPKGCDVHVFEPFTFVHLTDPHIDNDWAWIGDPQLFVTPNNCYRYSKAIFESTLHEVKEINPRFVLITGDMVEYNDDETLFNIYVDKIRQYFTSNGIRVYQVPGNHDRRNILLYSTNLNNYNRIIKPLNGPSPPEINALNDGYGDYYFDEGGYRFIGLDSGEDWSHIEAKISPEGSGLEYSQYNRLFESDLKDHPAKIIFMHHPVVNKGDDSAGADSIPNLCPEYGGNDMCIGAYRCWLIKDYCIPNDVRLVLSGHTHKSYLAYFADSDKPHLGTYFIQTPSATKDDGEFKHGYRVIELRKGKALPMIYTPTNKQPIPRFEGITACPVTFHVYDSKGRHTGLNASSGEVERNIPDSFYFGIYNISEKNESIRIVLYNTSESYRFEIVSNLTTKRQMQAELMTSPLSGSLNFTLEKQTNDSLTTISFINVSILENTTASVYVDPINPVEAYSTVKASSNYTMDIDLDGNGEIDERKEPDVINTDYAPTASILSPINNSLYLYGDEIAFNGTGTDLEDEILNNSSLLWLSSIDDLIGIGTELTTSNLSTGTHFIELMVNDSSDQTGMDNVTIIVIAPDLAIDTPNISFTNPYPIEGENIMINATIHNIGTANATNVTVQFFDGNPMNSTRIGANQTIASINIGENKSVSVVWNTTEEAGGNCIWVVVDPSDSIKEVDEGNNQANKSIFVSAPNRLHILKVQTDRAIYVENEAVLITCVVENASINISANVSADIENPDGIIDNITLMEGLIGNYNGLFMDTSLSGTYKITIYANQTGFIGDNESLSFEVLDTTPPASITNITNTTGSKWINWTWDNPSDPDFGYTLIYLNETWKTATSKGYYLVEGLNTSTEYEIETRTVDTEGNINETWVNQTARTSENEPPISSFTYTPEKAVVNQNITLNVSSSYDPDGQIVSFQLDFGDGGGAGGMWPVGMLEHAYLSAGNYTVNLTVTDDDGAVNSTSKVITVLELEEFIFDTGSSNNPYPSIMGNHTGTIKPNHTVIATKLYTYSCEGTGGHTEYAEIRNATWNATATWKGYRDDWHNITFDKTVVLLENKTYTYTIRTGSYPQIIHEQNYTTLDGSFINCTEFTDANGKKYDNWIPAIRLWRDTK